MRGSFNRIDPQSFEPVVSDVALREAHELLRQSEERFGQLIEHAPDAVFIHDSAGRILEVNPPACKSLGYSRDELLAMSVADFELEFEPANLTRQWAQLTPDKPITMQGRHLRKDGSIIPVEVRVSAIDFPGRKTFLANARDVSDRQQAQLRLRESEDRFRAAFGHAAIGMAIVSIDGRFIQVNPSLCRIVGYGEQELLARDFQSITHPDDLPPDLACVQQLLAGKIADYQMLKRYIHRDGRLIWVSLGVTLVRSESGKPLYFIAQIQDVTASKEAEDALRASEEEFRASFELASVGKLQVDLRTARILRVNSRLCQITGYSAEELCRMTFLDLTHPDDIPEGRRAAMKMLSGESNEYTVEKRYVRKDGRVIWTTVSAAVLHDSNNRPVRSITTIQDITERKMAEALEHDRRKVLELVALDAPLEKALIELGRAVDFQLETTTVALSLEDGVLSIHGSAEPHEWLRGLANGQLALAAMLAASAWASPDRCGVTGLATNGGWHGFLPVAASLGLQSCWTCLLRSPDDSPTGLLLTFSRREGGPTPAELQVLHTAADLGRICIDHHATTRQLAHLVRHDSLTGLPNRVFFQDRLQQAITLATRSGKPLALLALDVDHFKQINDTYGHDAGDCVLRSFAERIRGQLRQTDTIARMGGDEFILVLPELQDARGSIIVAEKLVNCLKEPFRVAGQNLIVTTSIGIAIYPDHGTDSGTLQRRADEQLYVVKKRGRNGYSIHTRPG